MPLARLVIVSLLSLAGCLVAQASSSKPAAPDAGKAPVVDVRVARSPLLAEQDQQFLSVWGQCAALRLQLDLPAKAPNAQLARVMAPRAEAMRHVSLGLAVIRDAEQFEQKAKLDADRWPRFVARRDGKVLQHFVTAIDRDLASIDALLALANTSRSSLVATLVLRAIEREVLAVHATERTVSLLSVLLEHSFPAAAKLAYSHLEFVLDAGVPDGGVRQQLAERAKHMWPAEDDDVRVGAWGTQALYPPEQTLTSALPPPADLPSRLLVLSALPADEAVLTRFIMGDFDPRILLHAHSLAAPRVAPRDAAQMFGWYRKAAQSWAGLHGRKVNAWKHGVISVLVAVLPKLPAKHLPWYGKHLVESNTGAAARAIALHRLACLERSRQQSWFDVPSGALSKIATTDVLPMWHYLGSHDQWTLPGCMLVAPCESSEQVTQHYCRSVLRSARMGEPAVELALLRSLWPNANPDVARAIVRRAMLHGAVGQKAVNGWLRDALRKRQALSATALELAVAHGLPQPLRVWPEQALELRALQELHDAFYADDISDLNALLKLPASHVSGGHLRAILHAASRLSQWSPQLALVVARATTAPQPDTRRAAYAVLTSDAAQTHEVSWLAQEAAFDVDIDVRRSP